MAAQLKSAAEIWDSLIALRSSLPLAVQQTVSFILVVDSSERRLLRKLALCSQRRSRHMYLESCPSS